MSIFEILYIISVSLQLSGSLLLLLYCFGNVDKSIIENKRQETHVEEETLHLGRTQPTPSEFSKNVWLTRIAFIQLSAGYLTSIWSEIDDQKRLMTFILIFILTGVLLSLSLFISKKISKRYKEESA